MSAAGLGRVIEAIARARAPKEPPTPAGPPLEGEPRLERPPCPLCGATRAELERTGGDTWVADAASSRLRFSVARCAVCTLRYTTPRFRPEYRHLAFSGSYPFYLRARRALAGEGGGPVESELAAFHSRAEGLVRQHPRPGRLLDVGGGDGVFSVVMGRRGWDGDYLSLVGGSAGALSTCPRPSPLSHAVPPLPAPSTRGGRRCPEAGCTPCRGSDGGALPSHNTVSKTLA